MPDFKELTREANANLQIEDPLTPGDPRLVDLSQVRGERRLLYDLVLLEYNSYWWQTHPVVRSLPAYLRVSKKLGFGE